jgi:hypothetical protein
MALVGLASGSAAGAPAPATAAADLKALGLRVQQDLARRLPVIDGAPERREILAIGPCKRPTAAERQELTQRLIGGLTEDANGAVVFGCQDRSGIVVDVSFDRIDGSGQRTGVWQVVRASAASSTATVTILAEYAGTSTEYFMEWAHEVMLRTLVLADIDRDGTRDVVIASDEREGGAPHHDVTLSVWLSHDRRIAKLGTFDDFVTVARTWSVAPFVLAIERHGAGGDGDRTRYRCLESTGVVDLCPAVADARHVGRMLEIAAWFASGHEYEPGTSPVPDRELLAGLLAELGVARPARASLLAAVPEATPAARVAREIRSFLAPSLPRRFGEIVEGPPPVEPRPGELAALLGDAPCAASPAEARRALTQVATWIRANDAEALVGHGDCTRGQPCRWSGPSAPEMGAACFDGSRGYVSASWRYSDNATGEQLARDVVFFGSPALAPVMARTTTGWDEVCVACSGFVVGHVLGARFYRHGTALFALVSGPDPAAPAAPATMTLLRNGVAVATAPQGATYGRFLDPDAEARDVVETSSPKGITYWHHDGSAWVTLVEVLYGDPVMPVTLTPAGRYLWKETNRALSRLVLAQFDAARWAGEAKVRAETRQFLVLAGASAAMLGRIDLEAAAASPRSP